MNQHNINAQYDFLEKMFERLIVARAHHSAHKAKSAGPFPDKQASKAHDAMTLALEGTALAIEYSIRDYLETHRDGK